MELMRSFATSQERLKKESFYSIVHNVLLTVIVIDIADNMRATRHAFAVEFKELLI